MKAGSPIAVVGRHERLRGRHGSRLVLDHYPGVVTRTGSASGADCAGAGPLRGLLHRDPCSAIRDPRSATSGAPRRRPPTARPPAPSPSSKCCCGSGPWTTSRPWPVWPPPPGRALTAGAVTAEARSCVKLGCATVPRGDTPPRVTALSAGGTTSYGSRLRTSMRYGWNSTDGGRRGRLHRGPEGHISVYAGNGCRHSPAAVPFTGGPPR